MQLLIEGEHRRCGNTAVGVPCYLNSVHRILTGILGSIISVFEYYTNLGHTSGCLQIYSYHRVSELFLNKLTFSSKVCYYLGCSTALFPTRATQAVGTPQCSLSFPHATHICPEAHNYHLAQNCVHNFSLWQLLKPAKIMTFSIPKLFLDNYPLSVIH